MKRCYKLDGMPWRKLYYDDFIDGCETQGIRLPNVALSPEFF